MLADGAESVNKYATLGVLARVRDAIQHCEV